MKHYFTLFAVLTALSALNASAGEEKKEPGEWSQKKCFKACMKEFDDRDKCAYICDPNIDPRK